MLASVLVCAYAGALPGLWLPMQTKQADALETAWNFVGSHVPLQTCEGVQSRYHVHAQSAPATSPHCKGHLANQHKQAEALVWSRAAQSADDALTGSVERIQGCLQRYATIYVNSADHKAQMVP